MTINYDLLVNTLSIQTESYKTHMMERYIKKFLKKNDIDYHTDTYGNIYATKGVTDIYPTMVCHIDTVHDINMNSVVKRHKNVLYSIDNTTFKRTGIGGDDKVGVFITLSCLVEFPNFKAVFFKDEEVGCVGSGHADMSFFDNSSLVLECDRQGYGDFVTDIYGIELCDDTLVTHLEDLLDTYQRKPCTGGLTDVKVIASKTDVMTANINCGYYYPHTDDEVVNIEDVQDTLNFCIDVFNITSDRLWRMKRTASVGGSYRYPYDYWYDEYPSQHVITSSDDIVDGCPKCNATDIVHDPYVNQWYCYSCDVYLTDDDILEYEIELENAEKEKTTNAE